MTTERRYCCGDIFYDEYTKQFYILSQVNDSQIDLISIGKTSNRFKNPIYVECVFNIGADTIAKLTNPGYEGPNLAPVLIDNLELRIIVKDGRISDVTYCGLKPKNLLVDNTRLTRKIDRKEVTIFEKA